MKNHTAVIIKGNPKFTENNPSANNFYDEIKKYLEELGCKVSFDDGDPHTLPKSADLWIGHSRGGDRLQFAPEGTKVVLLGSHREWAINHPQDNTVSSIGPSEVIPNEFHYVFTEEMKKAIKDVLKISIK